MEKLTVRSLFVSRLFWKFFVSILLAQMVAALAVGGAFWLKNRENEKIFERNQLASLESGPRAEDAISAAAAVLQYGGVPALQNYLRSMQHHQVYASDAQGNEVLDRKVAQTTLDQVREIVKQNPASTSVRLVQINPQQQFLLFLPNLKDPLDLPPDGYPSLFSAKTLREFSPKPPRVNDRDDGIARPQQVPSDQGKRPPPRDFSITPAIFIAAAIVASLLFAALLAWYFARQIVALRLAFAAASEGDLSPRFQSDLRNDELSDLGRDFDFMSQQIRSMMERQTKLLHDVSHELRSPLARLQAAIGLAHQQPDRTRLYLERMERESGRMDTLIGELLTLARLEAGAYRSDNGGNGSSKDGSQNENIDIHELLEELLPDASFEAGLQQSKISLLNHLPTAPIVRGQADLLARAIENILRNAIKYSPQQSHITIELASNPAHQQVSIKIMDQGSGVPEEELESIFLAFHRSTSNAQQFRGHGLGLAIAKQIILSHQGKIAASNLVSGGLCVEIILPDQATL